MISVRRRNLIETCGREPEASKNAARQVLRNFVGGTAGGEDQGWLAGKRAVMLGRRRARSARLKRWDVAVKVARRDLGSWCAVVLVDDAAEDVTASDRAAAGSADRVGVWLGELQATVWSRLVVVSNVLVEHRLDMSS
jgi:hypothetical protein